MKTCSGMFGHYMMHSGKCLYCGTTIEQANKQAAAKFAELVRKAKKSTK